MYMRLVSAGRAGCLVKNNAKGLSKSVLLRLPYYDDVVKQPLNLIIGGATSCGRFKGRPEEEYKGPQSSTPIFSKALEVQADWLLISSPAICRSPRRPYKLGQETIRVTTRKIPVLILASNS